MHVPLLQHTRPNSVSPKQQTQGSNPAAHLCRQRVQPALEKLGHARSALARRSVGIPRLLELTLHQRLGPLCGLLHRL